MLSDDSFYLLMDVAHRRANQPHEIIVAFCPCSLVASGTACMSRPRARCIRRRKIRHASVRGKSDDPDGDGPRDQFQNINEARPPCG
jgi:hypothetical protein